MKKNKNRFKKVKTTFTKVKNILKQRPFLSLGVFTFLVFSYQFIPFQELAKVLSRSTLPSICAEIYKKEKFFNLLEKLRNLPRCEIESIVNDLDLSDIDRIRKIEISLGSIENLHNPELENSAIGCFVISVTKLYFSNSINFRSFIQALLNALKKGYLSRRNYELILQMLAKRKIPIFEIIKNLDP